MSKNNLTRDEWNKLVEGMLERDKELVGTAFVPPKPGPDVPYHVQTAPLENTVTATMISAYARGEMGNPDPMYTDPDYGKYTRYASMIAPPTFINRFGGSPPRLNGPDFPGGNEFEGGESFDYSMNRVVKPGDQIHTVIKYLGYTEKTNPAKLYRLFLLQSETTCFNQRQEIVCKMGGKAMFQLTYPGDIEAMGSDMFKGREKKPHFSKEELNKLHAWYDDELAGKHRQGAEILYWEDVKEGAEMPMVWEGPLQITDVPMGGMGAFACGWAGVSKELDRALIDPETGEYQGGVVWHYNDAMAQVAGLPRAQGFGGQSQSGLAHLVCNWMGDDGWVKRFDAQMRGVRLYGDMMYIRGNVGRKYIEDGEHVVDLDFRGETQDGVLIAKGSATVKLISRED
jgi:hypothetical protein